MLNNLNAITTIGVKDINRARDFYEKKLGLKAVESAEPMEEVQLLKSGNTLVELYKSDFAGTNKATAISWIVGDDIFKEVDDLKKKGISFEHYDFPDAKLEGDVHVMGNIKAAWFKDPDGNILCLGNH
ncbi:VOC family protein [Peredibacter sp. HCB2-198]|uniref:VOC family protein n=1 Tax=Peredibacter sp. HCB2-198 TaxID=3383025 RepID=UPI0038B54CDC